MTNPGKARGSAFERDVVRVFNENGYPQVERRYGAGAQKDKGDLNGFAGAVVIECKAEKRIDLAGYADETLIEKANAKADLGVTVVKRRGKRAEHAYAVVPLTEMVALLKAAGY